MVLVDLHVHSTHSKRPSEWFLQKIGAQESYTDVEQIYRLAKQRGMSYVTVTDHNTIDGALELVARHPEDCFVSVEATTYFPENGCKIHLLIYDITEQQFADIQAARESIYTLRDYLREHRIACSVAHGTYNINGRLDIDTVEKLMLLFDVFEAINGARSRSSNRSWSKTLQRLTPNDLERLYDRHRIEPWGEDSWIKGFTGGSDDRAGLLVAETYTMTEDCSPSEFLHRVRDRETLAGGSHGDHKTLAFAVYKIAYDFSLHQAAGSGASPWQSISQMIFGEGRLGFKNWLALQKLKLGADSRDQIVGRFFENLVSNRSTEVSKAREQINRVYAGLSDLSDDFFSMVATSLEKDLRNGDAGRVIKNLSAALPAAFLAAPFFTSMRAMHRDRELRDELQRRFHHNARQPSRRLIWFSDTVTDLNGVSVTMRQLAECAHRTHRDMNIVTSLPEAEAHLLPPNTVNLPCIYTLTPDFYTAFTLRVPSLLRSLDIIAEMQPDEIVISTPGPVGLLGFAAARVLEVKCTGIYHTDFARQADFFIGDPWVSSMIESYTRGFFRRMDEVRVPSHEYIRMMSDRGLDASRMKLFRRGIEATYFVDDPEAQARIRREHAIPDGFVLLYAGRLGKEKNLAFLLQAFDRLLAEKPEAVLVVVGEGPELEALRRSTAERPRVILPGCVDRRELAHYYALADLFVFPSVTDTFGMVVLEAQACGLPAVVSDKGGPQEIVLDGQTGFVLAVDRPERWAAKCAEMMDRRLRDPRQYAAWRGEIHELFRTNYGWENVLDEMMGIAQEETPDLHPPPPARTPAPDMALS